jgi:hypothetical protein
LSNGLTIINETLASVGDIGMSKNAIKYKVKTVEELKADFEAGVVS